MNCSDKWPDRDSRSSKPAIYDALIGFGLFRTRPTRTVRTGEIRTKTEQLIAADDRDGPMHKTGKDARRWFEMSPTVDITRRGFRRRLAIASCIGSALFVGGCGLFGGGDEPADGSTPVKPDAAAEPRYQPFPPTTQPTPRESSTPLPQVLQPVSRPVIVGRLPEDGFLVYLVESDGPIRVANIDSGEEIVTFNAKAGEIVRVNPRGVALANQPVIGATLAPGNYGIYKLPPQGAGAVRTTQRRTAATPESASQPAVVAPPPGFQNLTPQTPPPTVPPAGTPPTADLPPPASQPTPPSTQ